MKLVSTQAIDWALSNQIAGVNTKSVHFGKGSSAQAIQIAIAQSDAPPSRKQLRDLFNDRKARKPITLMVTIVCGDQAYIFGPDPDTVELRLKLATAESFLNSILDQENGVLAYNRANALRRSIETTSMPGFTNNGLFASHYIRTSINKHPKWNASSQKALALQSLRHKNLIEGLGFEISGTPAQTLLLSAKGSANRAVAVLLDRSEGFDSKSQRFQASPVEWGLAIAKDNSAPWLIALNDAQLRLYPAKDGVGVGQKSQVETYFEIDLITIDEDKLGLLDLIFSAEALAEGGTAEQLLRDSQKFASELGSRLKERVYESVVPNLAKEVANQLRAKGHELNSEGLKLAYELTLRILFRLLFQAYAEDRGLLPAGRNERFDANSMKRWAEHLRDRDMTAEFGDSSTIWFDLMQIWDAIDQGNPDMQIPAYNGGLFGSDPELHPAGDLIRKLSVPDRVMGPTLRSLVIDDQTEDGVPGAVDFRSLSVREFGTIYEGLLESSLSVAEQDLTVDKQGAWVPAKDEDSVLAKSGEVYFHSASGERKATGSYYTPSFIVDHLIERSVEPALNEHLARVKKKIDAGDQAAAYAMFFDFRVADLAMGSAHFLVAAIDKIETIMRSFLVQEGNTIDRVSEELMRLEAAAKKALGADESAYAEIERASLLRRQIARRCIYGLDINPLAVELSRLAIWIHTFVPGLPMSSLEHNLVCANSLTGIGSVEEGLNALIPERATKNATTLFDDIVEKSLSEAKQLLENVASADEADKAQVKTAALTAMKAREAASKAKVVFDVAAANRTQIVSSGAAMVESDITALHLNPELQQFLDATQPAHMPYLFPEVFLRENPGFDVIVGNPPWEKLFVDDQRWWGTYFPGMRTMNPRDKKALIDKLKSERKDLLDLYSETQIKVSQLNAAISRRSFPGIGGAHLDLASAFAWVTWILLRKGGLMGQVFPRGNFVGSSLIEWRRQILNEGTFEDLVFLANSKQWVFASVHPQYTFSLCVVKKQPSTHFRISGPFHNIDEFTRGRRVQDYLNTDELRGWSENLSFPQLPASDTLDIFRQMHRHNGLSYASSHWDFRALQGDLNSSTERNLIHFKREDVSDPVEVWAGSSFNLWRSTGEPFGWSNRQEIRDFLLQKSIRSSANKKSAYFGLQIDEKSLPIDRSRVAFRLISSSTNTRTIIAGLVPPGTPLVHSAPVLHNRTGGVLQEAYLLGVMSSLPFDWVARRWVELNVTFEILYNLPVPAFDSQNPDVRRIATISASLIPDKALHALWLDELSQSGIEISFDSEIQESSLLAELDGRVANLYGLSKVQLSRLFATFHRGWQDSSRLQGALKHLKEGDK